jgi:hypothetical protein
VKYGQIVCGRLEPRNHGPKKNLKCKGRYPIAGTAAPAAAVLGGSSSGRRRRLRLQHLDDRTSDRLQGGSAETEYFCRYATEASCEQAYRGRERKHTQMSTVLGAPVC